MRGGAELLEEEPPALAAVFHQAHQAEQDWMEEESIEAVAAQEEQWNQYDNEVEEYMQVPDSINPEQEIDEPVVELPTQDPPHPPMGHHGPAADIPPVEDERRSRRGEAAYLGLHANDPVVEGGRGSVMQVIMCMLTILAEKNVPRVVFDMFMAMEQWSQCLCHIGQ
jgi:hypothetical protein